MINNLKRGISMKKVILLVIVISILGGNLLYSSDSIVTSSQFLEASPITKMKSEFAFALQQDDSTGKKVSSYQSHPDYILPKKALLFSALVPGAGELYCKSYWRSLAFVGIEVTAWTLYFVYRKKGDDKETEFMKYADDPNHGWSFTDYGIWYGKRTVEERKKFSHSIPGIIIADEGENATYDMSGTPIKTQQYYEMIGKYDQFICGWDGVGTDLSTSVTDPGSIYNFTHPERDYYMDMRYDSNQLYEKAINGAYVAMFNHILSAIDAAWVAKKHNRTLLTSELKFENKFFDYKHHAMLSLQVSW